MAQSAIAFGSNISPRKEHLRLAMEQLDALDGCKILAISNRYETDPVGGPPQDMFLNAALLLETACPPRSLLKSLLQIEKSMGRTRNMVNGPRIIDLDIIFYDNLILDEAALKLPHPRFRERGFVLLPLNDILSQFVDPLTGKTVSGLLEAWLHSGGTAYKPLGRLDQP